MRFINWNVLAGWVLTCSLVACGGGGGGEVAVSEPTPTPTPTRSSLYAAPPLAFGTSYDSTTAGSAKCAVFSFYSLTVDNKSGHVFAVGGNTAIAVMAGMLATSDGFPTVVCGSVSSSDSVTLFDGHHVSKSLAFTDDGRLLIALNGSAAKFDPLIPGQYSLSLGIRLDSIFVLAKDGTSYSSNGFYLRKTTATGVTSILAGVSEESPRSPATDGLGSAARFGGITSIAMNAHGDLFVTDSDAVRKISTATGQVTTIAGKLREPGAIDGNGAGARFNLGGSGNIVADSNNNLYVSDSGNHAVRRISAQGEVTTIAGRLGVAGRVLGTLPGLLIRPGAMAIDASNALYVAVDINTNQSRPEIIKIQ